MLNNFYDRIPSYKYAKQNCYWLTPIIDSGTVENLCEVEKELVDEFYTPSGKRSYEKYLDVHWLFIFTNFKPINTDVENFVDYFYKRYDGIFNKEKREIENRCDEFFKTIRKSNIKYLDHWISDLEKNSENGYGIILNCLKSYFLENDDYQI